MSNELTPTDLTVFASNLTGHVINDPSIAASDVAQILADFLQGGNVAEPINVLATLLNLYAHTEAQLLIDTLGSRAKALRWIEQVATEARFDDIAGGI